MQERQEEPKSEPEFDNRGEEKKEDSYNEYIKNEEKLSETFLLWKMVGSIKSLLPFLRRYLVNGMHRPSLWTAIGLVISFTVGILSFIFVYRSINHTGLLTDILVSLFISGFIIWFTFGIYRNLPRFFRFLCNPHTWKIVSLFFCLMCLPVILLVVDIKQYNDLIVRIILRELIPFALGYVIVVVFVGLIAASVIPRPNRKVILIIFILSEVFSIFFGFFLTFLILVLSGSSWALWLRQMAQTGHLTEYLFSIQTPAGFIALIVWLIWAYWKRKGELIFLTNWNKRSELIRQPGIGVKKLKNYFTIELGISNLYIQIWFWLIVLTMGTFFVSILPKQLYLISYCFLPVLVVPAFFLIRLTYRYLFIPIELERISIKAPGFISRAVLNATVVLFLLFLAWWVFYSLFLWNINISSQRFDLVAFRFIDGRGMIPQIGDFVFYTFALLTNSGFIELSPQTFLSKLSVMLSAATGIGLLVLFVGSALGIGKEERKEG